MLEKACSLEQGLLGFHEKDEKQPFKSRCASCYRRRHDHGADDGDHACAQANVEESRIEQVKMHEDLVASQTKNEELSKVTEELRQALQEQRGRPVVEEVASSSPPRVFPMPFAQAITDTPIPASVVPMKASFTGVEDPEAHITMFHTQMMLSGGSDAVYCKMFVSTL